MFIGGYEVDLVRGRELGVSSEHTQASTSQNEGELLSQKSKLGKGGDLPVDGTKAATGVSVGKVFKEKRGMSIQMSW